VDRGRADKFFEARLGADNPEITGNVTERYFFLEMCLAWGIPPATMEKRPDWQEMWAHWKFKNIRESQLREKAQMERSARGGH
jgi:hypothetical protein